MCFYIRLFFYYGSRGVYLTWVEEVVFLELELDLKRTWTLHETCTVFSMSPHVLAYVHLFGCFTDQVF